MCQPGSVAQNDATGRAEPRLDAQATDSLEPFPWELGIFDAHCHPTDVMASVESIPGMRARTLITMATRSQDQELVAEVAGKHGVRVREALSEARIEGEHVIPSYGWHPWFSHQLYDDYAAEPTYKPVKAGSEEDAGASKAAHYSSVLSPAPNDAEFLSALPVPTALSEFIASTRRRLQEHPIGLVGEIGLDKAFRLPRQWKETHEPARDEALTPGGREGRLLSPYHVKTPHQIVVLKAQLALAGDLCRAVSVHGVQAHGILYDALASTWRGHERAVIGRRQRKLAAKGAEDWNSDEDDDESQPGKKTGPKARPYPPRICLHSFGGSVELLKQYLNPAIPAKIFFSFSSCINMGTESSATKVVEVIQAAPEDRILVESDLHMAGEEMDAALEEMYRKVCQIKGWDLKDGVRRIARNFEEFVFG